MDGRTVALVPACNPSKGFAGKEARTGGIDSIYYRIECRRRCTSRRDCCGLYVAWTEGGALQKRGSLIAKLCERLGTFSLGWVETATGQSRPSMADRDV